MTILSKVKAMQRNLAFFKCLRTATHWSSYVKSRTEALVHGIDTKSHAIERFIDPLVYVTQKCACAFGISIVVVMQEKRGTRASYRIISAAPFQFRQKFKGPRTSLFLAFLFLLWLEFSMGEENHGKSKIKYMAHVSLQSWTNMH